MGLGEQGQGDQRVLGSGSDGFNSGINRFTWKYFANSPTAIKEDYDPSKEYIAPYPQYADQAHLNAAGYARIGECIAAAAELA